MSGRRSKKSQRLGSSRRGPKGLNRNIEKDEDDNDDRFQQIAESGDGQNEFHTTTDYHSAQSDHPPSSSIDQQTSALECPPHASLTEAELPERKRKMGSTRKSAGGFKVERKLGVRTTEELDEYVTQPITSATEEQHSSLIEDEQSRSSRFPSNLSLQTESSGLGGEPQETFMVVVSEKDAIHHQEITSHSYEVVSDTPINKAMGGSVHPGGATVAESDLLREDSAIFNELQTLSRQETPLVSTSGQKRRMGSTRKPLGGKHSENVGVQEHSRSMTENETKAEVSMSEEMAQMWDDVATDYPSSHTESSLVSNQSLLAERSELKEPDGLAGTETMNQSVGFPLVDPEKSLPETSIHHGAPLLNKGLDFTFGSHTEDCDVLNKVLEEAGSHLSDDNQHVPDANTSQDCRDVNKVKGKEEVLKQKEEPSRNSKTSSLSPRQDAQLEELVLNCEESPSLSQPNNIDHSTAQLIEGGNTSLDVPASNISHAEPTATNSPHEMSDAVEESQEIYVEIKHENNVCDVDSITCDSLTDLECADEDNRGSETDNGFELTDQGDARDHNVTQIIMEVRNNKEDGRTSPETVWISYQEPCEDSTEKEELHKEQEYSLTISQTQSGPPKDNAENMLENKEVREDKGETENTVINDVTSKSEEILSFKDSATETGSHAHQQLFMQTLDKEGYDLSESGNEESEKETILFSSESENAAFGRSVGRSEETEGIEEMDAAVLILDVEKPLTNVNTAYNYSKSDLQSRVLTEEQNDTSPAFQASKNVSTVIDSSLLLHVAVGSEETKIAEESDISPVIPEDSQDPYKLTTFHSETQVNEGDAEILPVGGDTDLKIQTPNKTFCSSTSEAVGTEENIHDVSVLVREFDINVNVDTVTVESNRTTESDFLQTSSEALKVSENPENEVSSDTNIIPEDPHREEKQSKSSPIAHKRKMGSTRRPLKGNKGQRKEIEHYDENETHNDEKEIFILEDEPSPDESMLQSSKDGAKEQEMEICEKNDVGPVEGSESALMQSSCSSDSVSEESTAVSVCHITESQTLTKLNEESQENTGDAERVPAEGDTESHSEIQTENRLSDLTTSEAERTEENICEATVLVGEAEFIVDSVTVESNTTESDLLQNYTFTDEKLEAFKVSENTENVSSVTDTGLLVQDVVTEGSGETNTIPDQSDTNIIPEDPHREEKQSKSSPIAHKRKMGSTRRPLGGNKGQRKGVKYDENETLDSEAMINVEKETFSLEYEPSPDESTSQSLKDGAKEQEMEICEKNDVGPVEGSESALMQSSCSSDSVSEESTVVSVCHITESQTLTKLNEESQENTGDAEKAAVGGDTDLGFEIKAQNPSFDSTTCKAEGTDEIPHDASVSVREHDVIAVTMESDMIAESVFLQSSLDVNVEALKVSENAEKEVPGETDTILKQSDTNIIPEDPHREETHSKSSPIAHKRKMGSTRRPLKGNKGQRKEIEHYDENETHNDEKEIFILEDEPSPDESMLQSSKDGAKEQEMEICEKNDVGPVEGSESALMQSSCSSDSVSEESTAVSVCHITESQILTKINEESQENTGDAERVPAEGDAESHSEIQTENKPSDLTTSEAERTEENICEATVLVGEAEFIVDSVTVESNTTESDLLQNYTFTDEKLEALKVYENTENVSSVTDTGLLVQNVVNEGSGKTNTIPDQSDTNIIPEDPHREEKQSKSSPIAHKRKMGSTRRPLGGNKGQRKGVKYDENETLDSEAMINVEKETFSLEYEPSPDESTSQSLKDGAKEQEMEICEKNDVGPVEGSESALMQSSCSSDSVSEESTAVSVCHITESQTLTKNIEESQENTGDAEKAAVGGDTDLGFEIKAQNQSFDSTTCKAEGTDEIPHDASVSVREHDVIAVTMESDMTAESFFLQCSLDVNVEALKVSENTENVSSVTDTGLLVQNVVNEGSGKTNTIPDQSDTNIIPEDPHREEKQSKSSPIAHKRKMGSTRRPLGGNKGQRKGVKYDENETLDSEAMINVEKETFSLEYEPSPDESTSQSLKDGAKEQEMEICEKNDVGPVEGSESALMQSSCSSDSVSEESTAVSVCHITESQTLTKNIEESQENTGDAEKAAVGGDTDLGFEIKAQYQSFDSTTCKAEGTDEIPHDASVSVREHDVIAVTMESDMTAESFFLQCSLDVNVEALKVSENTENVSSVTDTGLLVQNVVNEGSGKTNTIPDQSDTNIIPEDPHREEKQSKSSPIAHKRKMGSTRRPLGGNKGQRKGVKYDENETLDSEAMINVEKETFSLEYEPSPDESTSQSLKDGAKEQEMEICEKNDVGPVEGSKSALMQSSCSSDSVSEESTAVSVCHITESQTLTKLNEESQENTGDAKRVPAEGDTESHSEIQTENKPTNLTTSEAERTEENICEATVLVGEAEFIVDSVTVESNTTESDLLQNYTFTDAKLEALKVSENTENVSSVTDTGLLVQDVVTEGSGETNTIPDQSDTNIIPEDPHREEKQSKSSPIAHKRKMGSTRRPLGGSKGQRKEIEHYDENETHNDEKEIFILEDEPSPDESMLQSSKDGAKEQEIEICEKNDVGPVEGSESALMQSSCSSDSVSEEFTAVSVCPITESQTLTKLNEESQENTGDAEKAAVGGDTDVGFEIKAQYQSFDSTTCKAEGTDEIPHDASVSVREHDVIAVTMESDMTAESFFLQSSLDVNVEALKVSENAEKEVSGETDTILKQSDTNIIPEDPHREETHSKSSPIAHKRKMGSTRRPLKGNKGQRKEIEHYDENETHNDEKEIFILEDKPSPDESMLQSSKDGAKEQEMEICEKNDVGPVEGSESALMQSSCSSDSVSEESTAVSVCHITDSQTLTKINEESQENTGDAERVPAEGDAESHSEIQTENRLSDLKTSEAERTEENICEATVLVGEAEFIVDSVTVESNTTESDLLQNYTFTDAKLEALKVSENTENVSSVTDTGLLVQDVVTEGSGETNTIPDQSDTNIIPEDPHREEKQSKSSPIVHKRKMGSTRRPLKGNKGQRKEIEHYDENETHNDEKEIFILEDKPSPDESMLQSSKDGAKEQEMEICEKNDVGPVEGSESALMQSSCSSDSVSEESTAVSVCHITDSQTLTKINEESQENTGDAERVPAEGDAESHSEIQTENRLSDLKTSEAERTEENICEATVLVGEAEFIVDSVTVESNTTESDLLQNYTFTDAKLEALKVSENTENVSSVTDTGLLVQDVVTEGSGETNTIPDQSDTNIIPEDPHREEKQSKSSPIVHKRKMGSTRRPLGGNKGQRKVRVAVTGEEDTEILSEIQDQDNVVDHNVTQEIVNIRDDEDEERITTQLVGMSVQLCDNLEQRSDVSQTQTGPSQDDNGSHLLEVPERTADFVRDSLTSHSDLVLSDALLMEETQIHVSSEGLVMGDTCVPPTEVVEMHSVSNRSLQKRKMGSTRKRGKRMVNDEELEEEKEGEAENTTIDDRTTKSEEKLTLEEAITGSLVHQQVFSSSAGKEGLTKISEESKENTGDAESLPAEGDTQPHSEIQTENKPTNLTTSEAERTEENICEATVLVGEAEFIVDSITVESNTTESDLLQNYTFTDAQLEALKVSENTENVSSVTDTGLLVQDVVNERSGETNTIPDQSDTNIIPEDPHREEKQSKSSPIVQKRKMGSTRRPLRGNKGQRKGIKYDENGTLDSEAMINVEKETFSLEYEPSPDESTSQSLKDGAKEQEMEICEKNDVGPVEGSESALMQSSCSSDSVSEESTAVSVCHITESQTLTKLNEESQKNTGDAERVPAEGDAESHSEIQTENKPTNLTTSEAERTEENICEATVLVGEAEFIVDSVTVESNTTESDLLQNYTFTDEKLEALKVSENTENVSSVTDTGLLVQDVVNEGSGETNTIPDQSDTNIIPEDPHREEKQSKSSPIVHKRKMGSTRRPLGGNKGQRKVRVAVTGEEDTEILSEIQDQDNVVDHNVTQEIVNIRDDEDEERITTQLVGMSVQLCDNLEQRSDVSQTQTGPSQDDNGSHLLEVPERTADFVRDSLTSHSDLVLSDALLMEETQIHVSSEGLVMGDTCVPPTEVVEMHSVSNRSLQKRKMGSTRKRGKRMVNDEELEEEKEGEAENTTIDDRTTKSEEKLTLEEAITGSLVHQQVFSSSAGKEGLTKISEESKENTGDAESLPAEGDTQPHSEIQTENKPTNLTTSEAERTEENICEATVLVGEAEFIVDSITVESNTTESDLLQNYTFTDAQLEALKVSENTENVSSVTDTGLLVQDVVNERSGETNTIPDQSDTNIIPEDPHREEKQSKSSPIVQKRKMGSTRRPLRGNKGQRKGIKYDENGTLDSEAMINVEKETFSLEYEPSPDESTSQSLKDGAKEQEMEICEKNDVGPVEGSESALMQSSCSSDSVSEESTAVSVCHITESQTLTKINEESQENTGDAVRVPAEGDAESHSEIQTENKPSDLTTSEAERTEENICEATVLVGEAEFIVDSVTVESNTTESDLLQNYTFTDAKLEALKVSENTENVSSVTDTGLLVQDVVTEGSGETNTIPDQSDTNIIPEDPHREEKQSKSSPIVHKRKMGSTRRPLGGNKGQRKVRVEVTGEEDIETLSEIQDQDNVVDHNVTQEIMNIRDDEDEERITTELVGMSVQLCDNLEQRSDVSQTQTGPSQDDNGSHLLEVPERTADLVRDSLTSHSDLVLSDALLMEETQIHVSSEGLVMGDTCVPPTEVVEMHSVSNRSLQKRKMGSTRKRGKRMVNEEELEEEKEEAENTTIDDRTTKSEEKLTLEEAITGSLVHQQAFSSSAGKEGLTKINEESQENTGDAERVPAEGDTESHSEIQTEKNPSDLTTSEAERTEENICEATVLVGKAEFIVDSVTVESNTTESDLLQNYTFTDAKLKALKVSENTENVSSVTDTGLLVQDVVNEGSGETNTIPDQSDTNIIPEDPHREEKQSKSSPIAHKRKMGSTRRPLGGNKGQRKVRVEVTGEDTETLSEIQDQDNVVDHNVTQEIMNIRDDEDEEKITTQLVGMSVQLCDNLEQRSDVSQTQTGPSQDDNGSHLLEVPERTADLVRDSLTSHSDLVLSDALLMEETQIHVSSEGLVMGDTCVPPTEVVEMHSVSNRSLQKRKMGSTRKRGKRMVNEEELEEEKEGEAENTTIDDRNTKSEEKLTFEEAITGSLVHQQAFSSSAGKEGHEIQDEFASKSDVQTENSEKNDQNQAAEIVSDFPLGEVETYSVPEQSEIIGIIPEESHRKDVQSNLIPVVQKRKMGSTRKTLRGNKGQRREVESQKMDGGMATEQDTDPHLAIIEGENKWKLDEDVEQNFPVEFSHQAAISNMFSESEDGVKEDSLNIHDPSVVSEEKGMENTVNDSNSLNEATELYEGTTDTFVLTVSNEDVHQTMSADYLDPHVHGGSEPEQTETMCHVFPTQELKNTQDDVVHEKSSQKIPSTQEKKRKMGSTRRNPRVMHGKNMGGQDDKLSMAMDRGTKKAEEDLDDMPLASNISQPKEMSSEAVSTTDLESEIFVGATDLKGGENDYQNNSDPSGPTGPETPENPLVSADVTQHLQPETVTVEKRRKMGSTRKNVKEGRIRGKRDAYEHTETADTHLQMSQDSELSLVGKAVGEQTIHDYSDQSEDSLLSEIEKTLNKTSQSSSNYEFIVNEPNSGDLANTPYLNKPENSEIKSLQLKPSQSSKTHSEHNSPERQRRKMGSTRKSPRQQLKAERGDEDKENGEVEDNLEANKQEMKNLERAEVSVVDNISENKLNKEYLDVPSAQTNSSQLEETINPAVQERTSPSTKRKFGSRRTNKGKQGLGRLDASDSRSQLEDEVEDNLRNDNLTVCDPHLSSQPENQPISQPISEQSKMEPRNEEAAPKGTGAGLVSLDHIIKQDEVQFNVVMVGNSCVGKTSFIRRFHEGQFTQDYRSTIGVDTCIQTVVLPERTVKLQIWDTAGQERFHSITKQVFHRADGLLLMYEITCSKSFISVRDWIVQARERAPDDAIMILLGNKNDSVERKVQIQEGVDLAREYNIHFMECSAATGANVSESMRTIAELLVQRKTRREEHTTLRREPPPKKSGCC